MATCLNPAEYNLPGCTDFQFFQAWDPDFVNIINNEFPTVSVLSWFAMRALTLFNYRISYLLGVFLTTVGYLLGVFLTTVGCLLGGLF